jgi:hypothetical protein
MKAQSWRKVLNLTNTALVLGIVGAGAYWFTKVRPVSADAARPPKWTGEAFGQYQLNAKGVRSQAIWPVNAEQIKQLTRPDDLMNPIEKGGPFKWPYVGPVPPPKTEVAKPTEEIKVAPPTGLEVLGKPQILFSDPKGTVVVTWLHKDAPPGKGGVTVSRGDPFISPDEKDKREKQRAEMRAQEIGKPEAEKAEIEKSIEKMMKKGRFKLKDGWLVPGSAGVDRRVALVYDIYDETNDTLISTEFKEFGLASDAPKVDIGGNAPSAGGVAATGSKPSRPAGVAPPLSEVRIVVQNTSPSSRRVDFDDNAFDFVRNTDPDKLLDDVKTEDAKDAAGNGVGVKVSGVTAGSFASQFDVKPGDVLKSINGTPVHSRSEAVGVVKAIPKEATNVQVVIERNGRQLTYDVDPRDPKVRGAGGKVKFDNK